MSCCCTIKCPKARAFFLDVENKVASVWNHRVIREMRDSIPGKGARLFLAITVLILAIVLLAKAILVLGALAPYAVTGGLVLAKWSAIIFAGFIVLTFLYHIAMKVVGAIKGCLSSAAQQV